jgi:outer membrane autotransporter protein
MAAHVGLGVVKTISAHNTLDGYLKYFYSHQGGDDVTMHGSVSGDEKWSFDSVNSHRLRLGARLTHKIDDGNSVYGGLAYQYEFGGEARAHYNGGSTPSPSVKGSSGLLELGWQVKPGGPVTIDLGVTGWIGKQRGISAQLGAVWKF